MAVVAEAEVVFAVVDEGYGDGEVIEAAGGVNEFTVIPVSGVARFKRRIVKVNAAVV